MLWTLFTYEIVDSTRSWTMSQLIVAFWHTSITIKSNAAHHLATRKESAQICWLRFLAVSSAPSLFVPKRHLKISIWVLSRSGWSMSDTAEYSRYLQGVICRQASADTDFCRAGVNLLYRMRQLLNIKSIVNHLKKERTLGPSVYNRQMSVSRTGKAEINWSLERSSKKR